MKTKELIKMLKEADPSGELHVRMAGGVPKCAYPLPGYYDGNYSYIQDGKYHVSMTDKKVDVICWGIDDFMEEVFMNNDFSETKKEDAWKKVSEQFKIDWNLKMNPDLDNRSKRVIERISKSFEFEWGYVENERVGN